MTCKRALCSLQQVLISIRCSYLRDRRKQERYLARNATKLEAERKAAEEAERAAAAEAAAAVAAGEAKKLRQTERKAMQKERSRLRTICATPREHPWLLCVLRRIPLAAVELHLQNPAWILLDRVHVLSAIQAAACLQLEPT